MRRAFSVFLSFFAVLCTAAVVSATMSYEYTNNTTKRVSHNGTGPDYNGWFKLELPTLADPGWAYDSDVVTKFDITMSYNKADNPTTIEVFLDLDSNHSNYYNNAHIYNFTPTVDSSNKIYEHVFSIVDLGLKNLFDGRDSFWIGYGCHFNHIGTKVEINQHAVPEPTTMLLLGTGLIGLVGLGRKFKKN